MPVTFDSLASQHRKKLLNMAFKMTKNWDEAADLVQESLIRGYRGFGLYRGEASFTSWMYHVMFRCYLDAGRASRRRVRLVSMHGIMPDGSDFDAAVELDTFDIVARRLDHQDIVRKIRQLPEPQAMTLALWLMGESYEEIASETGTIVATVRSRVNRAKEKVRWAG